MLKWFVFSIMLLSVCLMSVGIAEEKSEPADVAGEWAITLTFVSGTGHHTAIIEQKGDKLSGNYKGEFLEGPLSGTVKGKTIDFSGRLSYMRLGVRFHFTGTIQGDTMKGTVEMDEYWTAKWIAKRKKVE